jgi:hypothetical protein
MKEQPLIFIVTLVTVLVLMWLEHQIK